MNLGAAFVLVGASVAGDGQSNWYKGIQLVLVYVMIAILFVFPSGRRALNAARAAAFTIVLKH